MYRKLFSKISKSGSKKSKRLTNDEQVDINKKQYKVHKSIEKNRIQLKKVFGKSDDIVIRDFEISRFNQTKVFICYVSGIINHETINEHIIKALMNAEHGSGFEKNFSTVNCYETIKNNILNVSELCETQLMKEVFNAILAGDTALFINNIDLVIIINTKNFESRNVEEPSGEHVVRGSREGFTENLSVNLSLIRRRIKNTNLIHEKMILGKQTQTIIFIAYLANIVNPKIVQEVKNRLNHIQIDAILDSGYIEEFIKDSPKSIFCTIGNSEKPDVVSAKLLEGRVAILCDGTPFVLTVPFLFIENIQSTEDYYTSFYASTFVRFIRVLSLFITWVTPALYIAITTFHHEMIPTVLLITMAASREGIPFPSSLEAILMILIFEILREAGLRMPRAVGQAISIVGALVLGEAAVAAGIASSPMVIVVAITGITDFVNPSLSNISIILRIVFVLLATWLGLYGVLIGFFFVVAHICSLRSFGVPYLAPLAPTIWKELKDAIIRAPLWSEQSRPESITWKDSQRQSPDLEPNPPTNSNGRRNRS